MGGDAGGGVVNWDGEGMVSGGGKGRGGGGGILHLLLQIGPGRLVLVFGRRPGRIPRPHPRIRPAKENVKRKWGGASASVYPREDRQSLGKGRALNKLPDCSILET